MKIHINTQVKNEGILLEHVLPFWLDYPVDRFVFYDDSSTDDSVDVIYDFFGDECEIFRGNDINVPHMSKTYNEAHMRNSMFEYSKSQNADLVIFLDADELMSKSMVENFGPIAEAALKHRLYFYWYNVVGSIDKIRQDPQYVNNFKDFMIHPPYAQPYDLDKSQPKLKAMHHTPRVPFSSLPVLQVPLDYGFIHLQAINIKFYVLKQLFYKVFEYKEYGRSPSELVFYDDVVNGMNFCETDTPKKIIGDWSFESSIFDKILKDRKYIEYINENSVPELITFGEEYLK